jgi:hypothetical protein
MPLLSANLATQLIEGTLPWQRSTQLHIETFLRAYTLHDSYWIGMHVNCGWEDSVISVFKFDPVWNASVCKPTFVTDWPILFMRFKCASLIGLLNFRTVGDINRGISGATVERICDGEVTTRIDDHYGDSVSIQHFPLIEILILSVNETVIDLPNLSI